MDFFSAFIRLCKIGLLTRGEESTISSNFILWFSPFYISELAGEAFSSSSLDFSLIVSLLVSIVGFSKLFYFWAGSYELHSLLIWSHYFILFYKLFVDIDRSSPRNLLSSSHNGLTIALMKPISLLAKVSLLSRSFK